MKRIIKNTHLTVAVNKQGAELSSIKSSSGREYIWEGDPAIWGRHAPVLFPVVGKLKDNSYSYGGKTYSMGQHGFARDMDFQFVEETDTSLAFRLLPDSESLGKYPFDFELTVNYKLSGSSLEVGYEVRNNSKTVMPFSIGAHPGFALNWREDDNVDDYYIEFEKNETLHTFFLDSNSLLSDQTSGVLNNEKVLPLKKDMFDRDALIFKNFKSTKLSLGSFKDKSRLTVEFPEFPYLGIWAKPGAPYVCIEPWFGHVDPAGTDGNILNKPGIIKLGPAEVFKCSHKIVIEEYL